LTIATTTPPSTIAGISPQLVPCRYAHRCGQLCRHAQGEVLDPDVFADMDCVLHHRRRDLLVFLLVTWALAALGFWLTYSWNEQRALAAMKASSDRELQRTVSRLEREIDKYGILPFAIATDRDVSAFLQSGDRSSGARDAMSSYLARLNTIAGAEQTYLIDPGGEISASSNWREATSFVGRNISYRPYFQEARAGKLSGYYGIGTTGNTPGYYLATAIEAEGRRIGVVAIKIDLGQLERDWLGGTDQPVLVSDSNRIIVLSSRPDWKYLSLGPLDPAKITQLDETQQYNRHIPGALAWRPIDYLADDSMLLVAGDQNGTRTYLADSRFVPAVAMTTTMLSDVTKIRNQTRERATIAAVLIMLATLSLHTINQRRLVSHERLSARDALQAAYIRLQQRFEERNRQLHATNEELRREVTERAKAVSTMRSFQDELMRTENLAVIGQLSAGLAHEINQPLAALSTLSENAVRFLELNDANTVRYNLERICDLVRRLGILTGRLRSFARRTDGELGPIDLIQSVDNAVALLGHRIGKEKIELVIHRSDHPIKAMGDAVRLEQVLVNLISNAMDAVLGNGEARIDIKVGIEDERAFIDVADNGHGLSATALARLFEPFFTTKKTSGLGLGLAISQNIVSGFGGSLTASNEPSGGARFRVSLRHVSAEEKDHG
jgi:two-component system C4-dicarboxylate transport sensor histidine kinase DctB